MRKVWILALALMLALTTAYAADARYDASGCDTQVNEDGSVSVLGIPGDPVPITWGEFLPRFERELIALEFTRDILFFDPMLSDGLWVRLMRVDDYSYVRVATTTDGDDGRVVELSISCDAEDDMMSELIRDFAACLFSAAARAENTFGDTVMRLMHLEPAFDVRNFDLDDCYWYQNGFEMYLGVRNELYTVGKVIYTGQYDTVPVAPLKGNPFYETPIAEGKCDVATFLERAETYLEMIFGAKPVKADSFLNDGRMMTAYSVNEQIYIAFYLSGESETSSIGNVLILDAEGYPPHVYTAGMVALSALTDMWDEQFFGSIYINGEDSLWDDLSALAPCAAYDGVTLYCVDMEDGPTAILFGE